MDERDRYAKGMEVRRAVLGDAHVDRAEQASTDFQRTLFEDSRSREAYEKLLAAAKAARDEALVYFMTQREATVLSRDLSWRARFQISQDKLRRRGRHSGVSSSGSWTTHADFLKSIDQVDQVWRLNGLYFTDEADIAIERFLDELLTGFDAALDRDTTDSKLNSDAGTRVARAYDRLRVELRHVLGLDRPSPKG